VHVAGEDQVPAAGLDRVEGAREVAEQDPQVGVGRREAARAAVEPGARVDARELDAAPAQLDLDRLVEQQPRRCEVVELGRTRERVAAERPVVVAEDDVRRPKPPEQAPQPGLGARVREQVARDADEVGRALRRPGDRALDGPRAARRDAEVEVREVRDPEAVELRRQARQLELALVQLDPAGLEPAVGER
jgi:hypothetical protein